MAEFIFKIIKFLLPIGFIFVFPVLVIIIGREYYTTTAIVDTQFEKPETIFCFAHNNINKQYKEKLLSRIDPEIIVLGTSRVGQFRSDFFIEPSKFANASNLVANIDDIYDFAKSLSENTKIKTIILGLDQEMFFGIGPAIDQNFFTRYSSLLILRARTIYLDYFYYHKFSFQQLFDLNRQTSNIGLIALVDNRGFRKDGSYRNGQILEDEQMFRKYIEETTKGMVVQIHADRGSFLYKKNIDEKSLIKLNQALKIFKDKKINIIGFMSPYPSVFFKEMMSVDDEYKKNIIELQQKIPLLFEESGFNYFDLSNGGGVVGGQDTEYSDINHGTDKLYLRVLIYLGDMDSRLRSYIDLPALKKLLQNTKKDYLDVQ